MNHSVIPISLQQITRAMLAATLVFCSIQAPFFNALHADSDLAKITDTIVDITNQYPQTGMDLDDKEIYEFSEEEMLTIVKNMVSRYSSQIPSGAIHQLKKAHKSLIKRLKDYKVTGISFGIDPNFAFIWDQQNPVIHVLYKNQSGYIKSRTYQAYINSFGLKFECAVKLNLMFFTDTNFNYYESSKDIVIAGGFDLTSGLQNIFGLGMDITYANFVNAPGGVVILGIPITIPLFFPVPVPGISIVTGGLLRPIA